MPLINLEKLKLYLSRALHLTSSPSSLGNAQLPETICAICYENSSAEVVVAGTAGGTNIGLEEDNTVHNPYVTNCGHVYCYWCVTSKMRIYEDEWGCLRCGERVTSVSRWVEKVGHDVELEPMETENV